MKLVPTDAVAMGERVAWAEFIDQFLRSGEPHMELVNDDGSYMVNQDAVRKYYAGRRYLERQDERPPVSFSLRLEDNQYHVTIRRRKW